ncbi:MAG: TRAP transporter small permease subunit [Pseudomonadota bacterium]
MEKPEEVISSDGSVAITDPGAVGVEAHNVADRFIVRISNIIAWIFPLLMVAICAQVFLRSAGMNQAWLDDFQWWLYGSAVLVGIAYAVTTDSHVRVDILYDNYPQDKKLRTNIFALVWLFLPFVILCWDVTIHYALVSVYADEGSDSPNGLHNLWILKCLMNASFVLMGIAAWAFSVRCLGKLTRPVLWKQLLWAFPSTMYLVNLAVYYAIWWALRLTSPAETTDREIGRAAIFDEYEFGNYDIPFTIMITVVVTLVVIGAARLLDRACTE